MSDFLSRHIGPSEKEIDEMLNSIGINSIESLIDKTIPSHIRLNGDLPIKDAISEHECLDLLYDLGEKNKIYKQNFM